MCNVKLKIIKFSFLLVFEYSIILHYRVTKKKDSDFNGDLKLFQHNICKNFDNFL